MKRFVATEVYAQKAFAGSHTAPDGRVGLSFHDSIDGTPVDQIEALAASTAASISGAYAVEGTAAKACNAAGALEACACNVAGASFNELWNAFETY